MKPGLRILAALTLAAIAAIAAWFLGRPADPLFAGRPASQWVNDLLSDDSNTRAGAQSALRELGEAGVPRIRALLRTSNAIWDPWLERLAAAAPFFRIEKKIDPVLCRQRGAEMIALLGPKGRAAAPELVRALANERTAPEAARALARVGTSAIPELARAVRNGRDQTRERAARLLREFKPLPPETIHVLLNATRDANASVRREAALTLGHAAGAYPRITKRFIDLSADPAPEVRVAAFESIARIRARSHETLEACKAALGDSDVRARLAAAKALWELEKDPERVVPALVSVLRTPERWQAAYALGQLGRAAEPAIPALVQTLREERVPRPFRTPPSSAFALGRIGAPAIPALSAVLDDADPSVRLGALLAFGIMREQARAAAPRLLRLLEDANAEVRHAAALTLAAIGAEPERIVAGLSECLRAEDIYMRFAAAAALRNIAPEGDWVILSE